MRPDRDKDRASVMSTPHRPAAFVGGPDPSTGIALAQRVVRLTMGVALAAPLLFLAVLAWSSYDTAMHKARQQAEAAAQLAAEHSSRMVQANAIVTRQVLSRLAQLAPEDIASQQPQLHRELLHLAEGLPHINSIWILGADGYALATSLTPQAPRFNYTDREYFQFHQSQRDRIYVTRLLRTRSTQELFFDVSARWEGPNDEFRGVINVTLRPEYVNEFYRNISQANPALSIALLRTDGYLIARWPKPPEVGDRLPDGHALLAALGREDRNGWLARRAGEAAPSNPTFVRNLMQWPLAVAVTVDRERVLQEWWRELVPLSIATVIAALLLLAALAFALRRTQRELAALDRLAEESAQRSKAEEQLRQAQKLEALGLLTGRVAHDFNNLLAVMQNNLHLLSRTQPQLADSAPLAGMQRAVKSGEQLTRKLLTFARRQALRPEVLDLEQALPHAADMVRMSVGGDVDAPVTVSIAVAPGTPPIEVDRSEFELAMLNLAVNARAAGAKRIDIRAEPATETVLPGASTAPPVPRRVQVTFTDDGAGMDDATRARAFEPFFTTRPAGEGTGLGLSQVYGMCVQAGGSISLESRVGRGTTVRMRLPAAAVDAVAAAASEPAAPELRARVLVVEDDVEVARATVSVLESLGARVTLVDSAAAALARLDPPADFDVVLSDIVMPGAMNGIALARTLQALHPALPVLLMTGHTPDLEEARRVAAGVLPKPFTPTALAGALRNAIEDKMRRSARPR